MKHPIAGAFVVVSVVLAGSGLSLALDPVPTDETTVVSSSVADEPTTTDAPVTTEVAPETSTTDVSSSTTSSAPESTTTVVDTTTTTVAATTTTSSSTTTTSSSTTTTSTSSTTTTTQPAGPPGPPRLPTHVFNVLERKLTLGWSAPLNLGAYSGYVVEQRPTPTSSWVVIGNTFNTSISVTGLFSGQSYHFRVAAKRGALVGAYLDFGSIALPALVAPAVRDPLPRSGAIVITWPTTLSGIPAGLGAPTSIRIERVTTGQTAFSLAGTTSLAAGSFTLSGLTNGRQYWMRVGAVYRTGDIGWSRTLTTIPRTVPTAPLKPLFVAGLAAVGVQWGLSASNGGAPISGFRVQLSLNGSNWRDWTLNAQPWTVANSYRSTSVIFRPTSALLKTFIVPGRRVWVRVAAVNAAGAGPFTLIGSGVPYTYPTSPQHVRAALGDRSITMSWTAPSSTGFSPLRPYTVELAIWGTKTWRTFARTSATTVKVTGLVPNVHYCVRLVAWNTAGLGAATVPIAFYANSTRPADVTGRGCPA